MLQTGNQVDQDLVPSCSSRQDTVIWEEAINVGRHQKQSSKHGR